MNPRCPPNATHLECFCIGKLTQIILQNTLGFVLDYHQRDIPKHTLCGRPITACLMASNVWRSTLACADQWQSSAHINGGVVQMRFLAGSWHWTLGSTKGIVIFLNLDEARIGQLGFRVPDILTMHLGQPCSSGLTKALTERILQVLRPYGTRQACYYEVVGREAIILTTVAFSPHTAPLPWPVTHCAPTNSRS